MLFFGRKKRLIDFAPSPGRADAIPPAVAQNLRKLPENADPHQRDVGLSAGNPGIYRIADDLAIVQVLRSIPPVVNDPFAYGQIAAAHALGPVYARGATPTTALKLLGYPQSKDTGDWLGDIERGGDEQLRAAGALSVGDHTVRNAEIQFGYAVTGLVDPRKIVTCATARVGDKLVLTKALGTGFVIAAHRVDACPTEVFQAACASMIQRNDAARDAMLAAGAHAATDIAGFGLAGHAYALAVASQVTLVFEAARLPLLPGIGKFAHKSYLTRAGAANGHAVAAGLRIEGNPESACLEAFYDPQTSGGLLISVAPDTAEALVADCHARGATAAGIVGEVVEQNAIALILRG